MRYSISCKIILSTFSNMVHCAKPSGLQQQPDIEHNHSQMLHQPVFIHGNVCIHEPGYAWVPELLTMRSQSLYKDALKVVDHQHISSASLSFPHRHVHLTSTAMAGQHLHSSMLCVTFSNSLVCQSLDGRV